MQQHEDLRTFIGRVRRRWFLQVALRTAGRAAAAAAVVGLFGLTLNWLFAPAGMLLILLAGMTILVAAVAAAALGGQTQRRPGERQVARFIEERMAGLSGAQPLEDVLVSAVDGGGASESAAAVRPLLIQDALRRLTGITPQQILPAARLRAAVAEAGAGTAVLIVVLAVAHAPLSQALETAWVTLLPGAVHVEVLPGDARVVAGQPVRIEAVVRVGNKVLTRFTPLLTVSAGTEQRTVGMLQEGEIFQFPFDSVDRTFRYSITAGSATSPEYTVTALFAPRVERIELDYEYPSFTGLPARRDENGGDIYAPAGTRVRIRIHTDKPIATGELAFGDQTARSFRRADDRVLEADLVLARDDTYRVHLADRDGLRSTGETEYFIRLMDDRPPDVRILRPAGDQRITPLEEVVIEARADDDYGISRFELVYSVPGGVTRTVPFTSVSGTQVAKVGAYLLAAEDLKVQPGDVITYYARAVDVGRGKRPTETKSDMYFLEVRPFGEEFVTAESQAAGGGRAGAQLESLIAAQKEIIAATWNLERRSGAGRSAADLEAVARAQAELKAQAEQMSAGARGRMRSPMPQQVLPPQQNERSARGGDSVSAAVEAMGRAVEHLQGSRTSEAIPHEMAALQGLLQAQAEIRRRQVMQQQAGGGSGGYGRQGQDLSALFDKELQREQRTNYETRSPMDEDPGQHDSDSALDRIRDLARRQEELSRQQRELADSRLGSEERRRHLERLAREQAELREELEQLARQMDQQGSQAREGQPQADPQGEQGQSAQQTGQSSGGPTQTRSRAGDLRDASAQMKSAASELHRQEPGAAAESSARAAGELRRVEQQLRGDSPETRHRMAGELQLEAQQIADEQRRIAAQAGRLEKQEDPATADARRRLAGEKDHLADRVDALQRAATELGSQPDHGSARGGPADRAAEAARELDRQQISQRMRDTAEEMRAAADPQAGDRRQQAGSSPATAEDQIAKALDKVVEHLGGASPESRALSTRFDEAREMRERLDRLEERMRDAETREQKGAREQSDNPARQGGQSGRQGSEGGQAAPEERATEQTSEVQQLREEYARELQRTRDALGKLQGAAPQSGQGGSTPERHEWSQSAPGNESFKQDFSRWESLRKDVDLALERYEASVAAQLAREAPGERLSAGGSEGVPESYRRLIARYYEALARVRK